MQQTNFNDLRPEPDMHMFVPNFDHCIVFHVPFFCRIKSEQNWCANEKKVFKANIYFVGVFFTQEINLKKDVIIKSI